MPLEHAWVHVVSSGVNDRATAAWARADWKALAEELVALATERGDAALIAPVLASDAQLIGTSRLAPHARAIEALPPGPVRDGALAFLVLLDPDAPRAADPARHAVAALDEPDPPLAAALATSTATILSDRGRWAEAAWFSDRAHAIITRMRESGSAAPPLDELWFRMMAVAVLVEWNTYAGTARVDELTAALSVPRARNLLRAHHGPALVALGQVHAARGEFGAAAVSVARGIPLLPSRSLVRASAQAMLAYVKFRQGDWAGARHAAAAVTDVDTPESPWARTLLAAVAALEPAVSGDLDLARRRIDEALDAQAAHSSLQAAAILLHARIAVAIGENDWTGMLQLLDDAEEPGYRRMFTDHEWRALTAMALRNARRHERYREVVDTWRAADDAETHPYYWAHVALLAELDGDAAHALEAARRAREAISDRDDPLGRTWTRIVVGTIVSLFDDATRGMESYESARAELAALGAEGFVRLCTRIIEHSATRLAHASGDARSALTPQQRRVAELVAEGYTSTEIGEILYLSKKTIDFHVANIVSRLGLTSRRELARLFSTQT